MFEIIETRLCFPKKYIKRGHVKRNAAIDVHKMLKI